MKIHKKNLCQSLFFVNVVALQPPVLWATVSEYGQIIIKLIILQNHLYLKWNASQNVFGENLGDSYFAKLCLLLTLLKKQKINNELN